LEYDADVSSCGDYRLSFTYTSGESRPVRLSIDGKVVKTTALSAVTGTFSFSGQKEAALPELILPLQAGKHVIRLERMGPFPHIGGARLYPY
jgi:hypothetical protein